MSNVSTPTPSPEQVSRVLTAAFEQLTEGVIIADRDGRLIYVNEAAERIHGVSELNVEPDDYSTAYSLLTMDGEPYPPLELPLALAVREGVASDETYWRIARPDGTEVVALGRARPVCDDEGRQIGSVLVMRDETIRENERRELQRAKEMSDMLLREIHHRVKNNLQVVSSLMGLQSRKLSSEDARIALRELSSRIDVIADIHRSLYETGETDTIEVVAYLRSLARRTLTGLADSFGVSWSFEGTGECILSIEKAVSLALAVNELVLNALKFGNGESREPQIRLAVTANDGQLSLVYEDHGLSSHVPNELDRAEWGFRNVLLTGLKRQLGGRISETISNGHYRLEFDVGMPCED
jgi:PAS domain S-box-containing protein